MTTETEMKLRPGLVLRGAYTSPSPEGRFAPGASSFVDPDSLTLCSPDGGPVAVPAVLAWIASGVFPPTAYDLAQRLCYAHEHPLTATTGRVAGMPARTTQPVAAGETAHMTAAV